MANEQKMPQITEHYCRQDMLHGTERHDQSQLPQNGLHHFETNTITQNQWSWLQEPHVIYLCTCFSFVSARQHHHVCTLLPYHVTGKEQILQIWDLRLSQHCLWAVMQHHVTDTHQCLRGSGCLHHLGKRWEAACTSETLHPSTRLSQQVFKLEKEIPIKLWMGLSVVLSIWTLSTKLKAMKQQVESKHKISTVCSYKMIK